MKIYSHCLPSTEWKMHNFIFNKFHLFKQPMFWTNNRRSTVTSAGCLSRYKPLYAFPVQENVRPLSGMKIPAPKCDRLRSSSSGTKKQQPGFILAAVFNVFLLNHIKILTTPLLIASCNLRKNSKELIVRRASCIII